MSARSILARRVAFLLLFLGAGLMLAQSCPGGAFINTGSLTTARGGHTATLLLDGRVLVAGGSPGHLASAELYDPASGTWTPTGSLTKGRGIHTATLLPNGKVLVAGGFDGTFSMASAELYDPVSGTWTPTGNLAAERENHTATLLPSGQVHIAGGIAAGTDYIVGIHASAELYDPVSGTWTATGSLASPRTGHTAILLPNGQELVAGGFNETSGYLTSAELYDPVSGTWTATGDLATERMNHTATLLPNGQVLVVGDTSGYLANAELYDPASGAWTATASLSTARDSHTATWLPAGQVLVAGGYNFPDGELASAELYDPASGAWTAADSLATARRGHTATLLPDGQVLVAGGYGASGYLASAELYDPAIVAIHVTNGNDDGPGSLRAAIRDAAPSTRIDFRFTGVVLLTSDELLVDEDLTIVGPGSAMLTISRDPNSSATFRILEVSADANVDLSGVTLSNGYTPDAPGGAILNNGMLNLEEVRITNNSAGSLGFISPTIGDGGGCDNSDGAEMTLTNCSVDGNNSVGSGGGILNSGTLTVTNSAISGNTAGYGGGIYSTGTLTMTNCTITGNATFTFGHLGFQGGHGGGLFVSGSTVLVSDTISANEAPWPGGGIIGGSSVNITNCIVAANTQGGAQGVITEETDISGMVQSGGYNLIGVSSDDDGFGPPTDLTGDTVTPLDPKLGPLQDNGGLTSTMSLLPGSPALDHGISAGLATDQTGAPRTADQSNIANPPGGDGTDIGAVEVPVTGGTFANISTRMSVGSSDNALIGGFIITGTQAKKVMVRAIGASLPVFGVLADPILELHDSNDLTIATNDNWQDSPDRQAIIDSTLPPSDDMESAIIMTLDPAAYTAVVRGVGDTIGVGLVEIYDLDSTVDSKLANISTRGFVQIEDNVMIGGLIILGVNPTTTLVRAIGPSLPVSGALQDPTLELHNSDGATIGANDNWRSDHEAEIIATTLAPTNDAESAILVALVPSAYTAIVRGANGTTGVALVEAYQLDN